MTATFSGCCVNANRRDFPWKFSDSVRRYANLQVTGGSVPLEDKFDWLSHDEYVAYAPFLLAAEKLDCVVDLACGLGRVSAYLNAQLRHAGFDPHFILVDSSQDPAGKPKYGWDSGHDDFYNSLDSTVQFCRDNGMRDFATFDIRRNPIQDLAGLPDVVISMLGYGFHIPLSDCIRSIHEICRPDTVVILGIACYDDDPDWAAKNDFRDLFARREIVAFQSRYRTHEGRIVMFTGAKQ